MTIDVSQDLTARQQKLLDFFHAHLLQHGAQPGFREIREHMDNIGSHAVKGHMDALVKKGWLEWPERKGEAKAMILRRQPDGTPFAGLRFVPAPENFR